MLLVSVWWRLAIAGVAVAAIWGAALWVMPSTPSTAVSQPAARVAQLGAEPQPPTSAAALRAVVWSGMTAPGGGRFDRFDVAGQPILAPVNGRGQVAFYATVLHATAREGIYLADAGQVGKLAAFGDALPGGRTLAEFTHPLPALNAAGHAAFVAQVAGGRATEGVFLVGPTGVQTIALAGDDAPGLPTGVLVGFDAPSLNDNDELAFVATVRRGRDLLDVLYFWNRQRLQRILAEGDRLLRVGGVMDKIGGPALNNAGVIAFSAAIFKGPALGGIFVAGTRDLRLITGTGDRAPNDAMIQRFSERVAIGDDGWVTFGAHVGDGGKSREALLRAGPDGLAETAVEGGAAPGGGRYAGFGPWPTVEPAGATGFVAAIDGGPGPLAVFALAAGKTQRIARMGEMLPDGRSIGRLSLNNVAATGPGGALTFVTLQEGDERSAIYCHCPGSSR